MKLPKLSAEYLHHAESRNARYTCSARSYPPFNFKGRQGQSGGLRCRDWPGYCCQARCEAGSSPLPSGGILAGLQAGTSLGLTRDQTLRYVVGPQALRAAVPSLSNSLISLIRDTSLVSVIAVTELMLATKELISTTFQPFRCTWRRPFYWVLSLSFEQIQRWMEKRVAYPY